MKIPKIAENMIMLYLLSIAKLLLPLLTLPYLTRVLSVECYGVASYVKAVMSYMQLTVDFGFVLSGTKDIVAAKNDRKKLCAECSDILAARLLISGVCFLVLLGLSFLLPILKAYKLYTLLSFGSVFLSVFLFDYLFRGLEKMHIITVRFLIMRGISTALTFVFVSSDADILWIPILDLLGSFVAIPMVLVQLKKLDVHICFSGIGAALLKLKESAVYFLSNMASTVFSVLNTILIGAFLSTKEVAYWSVCLQLVIAVQTMYNPIIDGVYPEMLKSRNLALIKKILKIFMPIVLLGSAFCIIAAGPILRIVGGAQYAEAMHLFRLLIPVLIFSFPAMLIGWPVLGSIGKQKQVSETTIISSLFQLVGLLFLIVFESFNLAAIALLRCITELVLLISRGCFCYRFRKEYM